MVRRTLRNRGSGMYSPKKDKSSYAMLIGNRAQVGHGTAYKTSGGLTRKDLIFSKWGRWVSKKKHFTAKREKRLQKHGFFAKKGSFGVVQK